MTDEEVKHYDGKWKRLDTEIATLRAEVDRLTEINADAAIRLDDRLLRIEKAEAALEQERVRLAGCLVAAEGNNQNPAKQGDYGWSLAYQTVLDLRAELEEAKAAIDAVLNLYPNLENYIDSARRAAK